MTTAPPPSATEREQATDHAQAWAAEAGLAPNADALHDLFTNREANPLAEDLFLELLDQLGISSE